MFSFYYWIRWIRNILKRHLTYFYWSVANYALFKLFLISWDIKDQQTIKNVFFLPLTTGEIGTPLLKFTGCLSFLTAVCSKGPFVVCIRSFIPFWSEFPTPILLLHFGQTLHVFILCPFVCLCNAWSVCVHTFLIFLKV